MPLGTDTHELEGFGPTSNDPGHIETGRLATRVTAVKFFPIQKRATIVHSDLVRGGRNRAGSLRDHLVLKATCQYFDALFGSVFFQKGFPFFQVFARNAILFGLASL